MVLTIPQFTSLSQYVSVQIVTGMAKHKVLAFIALAEGITNVAISVILIQKIGLMGVALGSAISGVVATAFLTPWYTLHTLNVTVRQYWVNSFTRPLAAAMPAACVAYACMVWVKNPSWLVFGLEVCAVSIVFALPACFICFGPDERALVLEKVRGAFQRRRATCET